MIKLVKPTIEHKDNRIKHPDEEILFDLPLESFLIKHKPIAVTIASSDFDIVKNMRNQ